jgi:hypothetical protein
MKPKNKKEDKINNINIKNKEKNTKNKVITKYKSKISYDIKNDIKNKNKTNEINKNKSQSSFLRRKAYNIKFIPSKKSNSNKKRYSTNFYIDLQKINNEVNKESCKKNIYTVNLNDTSNNNLNENNNNNNNNNKSIISNNNSNNNLNNSYFKLYTNRSTNNSMKNWRSKTPIKNNNYNNNENKTLSIDKKLNKNYFDNILENKKIRENYIINHKFNEYKDIRLFENIFLKNNNNTVNNNNNLQNIIKKKYSEINKNKSAPALKKIRKENPIKLINFETNNKFNNRYLINDNKIIENLNNKVDKDYSYDTLINKININNYNENITNTAKEIIENKNKLLNDIITKAGIEIKI